MSVLRFAALISIAGTAALAAACSDSERAPTAVNRPNAAAAPLADVIPAPLDPFTYRASVGPYRILQLPDFMIQSHATSDVVMQRSVFAPGAGAWHTHAGPSLVYVIQGQIKLTEWSEKTGCTDTPVRGPGEVYFEEGDHVHRAVVVSNQSAVLMVTRFNIPPGTPITNPVPAPAC
jgi:quercetin dioxygenase-like cupin family protein